MSAPKLTGFRAGDVLFKEGESGQHAFIIKEGKVRISKTIDDKVVTLGELNNGACFGEMAVISNAARVATATAMTDCQIYKIDKTNIDHMLQETTPMFRAILLSLIKRVTNLNEAITEGTTLSDPYLSLAHLLMLMAKAESQVSTAGSQSSSIREVNMDHAVEQIRLVLGHTHKAAHEKLQRKAKLNLITLNTNKPVPTICFDADTLIQQTQQMLEFLQLKQDKPTAQAEFVNIEEMARELGTSPKRVMEAVWGGKIAESAVFFKRQAVIDSINKDKQSAKLLT